MKPLPLLLIATVFLHCGDDTTPQTDLGVDATEDLQREPRDSLEATEDALPDVPADQDARDATADTPTDTADDLPLGDNIIRNGGFEDWTGDVPDFWLGEESNLSSDAILMVSSGAHEGSRACRLLNADDGHLRFTTAPMAIDTGHYDCESWVRGQGEVRNARYDGDFSSYSSYTTVDSTWTSIAYDFSVQEDLADGFELIFSVRNTGPDGVQLDAVFCARRAEPCDLITCEEWQECDNATSSCEPLWDRCDDGDDCLDWETCDAHHECVLAEGRCDTTADCDLDSATPVCDTDSHTCVEGDPCAGVDCEEWQVCDPDLGRCVLDEGRCDSTLDCLNDQPACDPVSHTCVSADHAANLFPNGGFEAWSEREIPYHGTALVPDGWYGLVFGDGSDATFMDTEIDPDLVVPYTTTPHSGDTALQLIQTDIADRFTSEGFAIPPGSYTCAYWVRGHGGIRHRTYSKAGLSPETDRLDIDTDEWLQVPFDIPSNTTEFRLVFYASFTQADRDHVQIDDVVCTLDP